MLKKSGLKITRPHSNLLSIYQGLYNLYIYHMSLCIYVVLYIWISIRLPAYIHIYIYGTPPMYLPFSCFPVQVRSSASRCRFMSSRGHGLSKIRWCSYTQYQSCSCTQSQNSTVAIENTNKSVIQGAKSIRKTNKSNTQGV